MPDTPRPADPAAATITDFGAANPLCPDAARLRGTARRGEARALVDHSGDRLPLPERREGAHIQVGGRLYRLIVYRHPPRTEPFSPARPRSKRRGGGPQ